MRCTAAALFLAGAVALPELVDLLDMVEKNPYVNAGALEVLGVPIDMAQIKLGAYVADAPDLARALVPRARPDLAVALYACSSGASPEVPTTSS